MPVLFTLTTTACVSKQPVQKEIILPPKPQRTQQKEPENLQDVANLLNYYEHLVQEWETWGYFVDKMISENP